MEPITSMILVISPMSFLEVIPVINTILLANTTPAINIIPSNNILSASSMVPTIVTPTTTDKTPDLVYSTDRTTRSPGSTRIGTNPRILTSLTPLMKIKTFTKNTSKALSSPNRRIAVLETIRLILCKRF